ncbi:MAG: alpha-(1-_3)-arabinofuranosyltransferase [Janibacter sp.]|nr:alpha-(1->3)-arabinofuranosyltransferase [Janibacter sp.]
MSRAVRLRPAHLAGLLVVWAIPWSVPPGRIVEDTKNDLYINAWGFLQRAMNLWDPQVTWGGLSNQGYGYLFPMGPFFALGSHLAPVWVVQRCWWMLLLTLAYIGVHGLLRSAGVGTPGTRVIGAVAYVLAPRVISTVAGLSAEIESQLMAPLILWPLVSSWRGRLQPTTAALLSGVAILGCGGVNASATLLGLAPSGLFLVTRARWWRARLTWTWALAAFAGIAWWLGPLLIMGRYAPPFLDWIENARVVSQPIGLLDIMRGTTHWLGHVVTPGGAWWPAGYDLASSPGLIVLTSVVAALGLCGLAVRSLPLRGFAWLSLALGVIAMSIAHSGPLDSPLAVHAQMLFDGPLAPFRNIHKADALVRLPMVLGLTHALGLVLRWRPQRAWLPAVAVACAAVTVVGAGAPAFTGSVAPRGAFEETPDHWVELGKWLDEHREVGGTLVVPAANFGEYSWGRPIDEPLRALTSAPYAVRDAVPIAPAGSIRLLDEVERRLQTGRSIGGATQVLRSAGVGYIVVRNDLATRESGQPPVALARSAVRSTPSVTFVRGFGARFDDITGEPVFPVEVYAIDGEVQPAATLWDPTQVLGATGASEDLARLADAGMGERPFIFDGDRTTHFTPRATVTTDGFRARTRWFGATRGQDTTDTLSRRELAGASDYLPWDDESLRSTVSVEGIRSVTASSSVARDLTFAGLQPGLRPYAALDGNLSTGWVTMWDERPTLTVDLGAVRHVGYVDITPFDSAGQVPGHLAQASQVTITTDRGKRTVAVDEGPNRIDLPDGATGEVVISIDATVNGPPDDHITGLAEVVIDGVPTAEVITAPTSQDSEDAEGVVLGAGLPGRAGCLSGADGFVCLGGLFSRPEASGTLIREFEAAPGEDWSIKGTLRASSREALGPQTRQPEVVVSASSDRSAAMASAPSGILDDDPRTAWSPDPGDDSPKVTLAYSDPVTVSTVRFHTRNDWAQRASPVVVVKVGGREYTRRIDKRGELTIPATTGRVVSFTVISVPGSSSVAGIDLSELELDGVDARVSVPPVKARCGQGPLLTVDGMDVPTRVRAPRDGRYGFAPVRWQACGPVSLQGRTHRVELSAWRGFAPATAVMTRGLVSESAGEPLVPRSRPTPSCGGMEVDVQSSATDQLLVLTQNANPGWEATLRGQPLVQQVVDGRRQGFVVPAWSEGTVKVTFGPNHAYQGALVLGGGLALVLVIAAASSTVRSRRRRGVDGVRGLGQPAAWSRIAVAGGVLAVAWLMTGVPGALVGAVALAAGRRLPGAIRICVVFTVVVGCAVARALIAPGALHPDWLEGAIRLALLGVLCLAVAGHTRGKPHAR